MPKRDAPEFYYDEKRKQYRKRLKDPATGKWSVDVWASTKGELREKVRAKQAELAARTPSDRLFVYQYAAQWYKLNTASLTERGKQGPRNAINNHICPAIGQMPLADVRPDDIRQVMLEAEKKGLSKASQQKIVNTLKRIFDAAEENGLIKRSPCRKLKAGGAKTKEKIPLTRKQQQTVLDVMQGTQIYPFIMLCLFCGLRREEALGLCWDCVHLDDAAPWLEVQRAMHWDHNKPEVTEELKSEAAHRKLPIPAPLGAYLRTLPHRSDYVCHTGKNVPYSETAFRRAWEAVTAREEHTMTYKMRGKDVTVNLKVGDHVPYRSFDVAFDFHFTPHQLRHTYITELILGGTPIKRVQYLAGHASVILTLQVYTHMLENAPADTLASVDASFSHFTDDGVHGLGVRT